MVRSASSNLTMTLIVCDHCLGFFLLFLLRCTLVKKSFKSSLAFVRLPWKSLGVPKQWNFRPGQYLLVNVSSISCLQWHPFTITSAPDQEYVSLHIHAAGDWTKDVHAVIMNGRHMLLESQKYGNLNFSKYRFLPKLNVCGPYMSPADQTFRYSTSVLIGCGVGITPYASVLRHFKSQMQSFSISKSFVTRKIYLIWICRDAESFKCLLEFLNVIEIEGMDNYVETSLYWTVKSIDAKTCGAIQMGHLENFDPISGLRSAKTYIGRPNWNTIFHKISDDNPHAIVGVFPCGPKPVVRNIARACKIKFHSDAAFILHEEIF
eukprot:Partr_v1_DN27878_c1_g1_i4_m22574 putative NADPH- oxidase